MIKTVCLDANIIIRYLEADNPSLSPKAKELFSKAEKGSTKIYIDEVIIAEVIWVLSSFYEQSRQTISNKLTSLLSPKWIINPRKKLILATLNSYSVSNLSYIDNWVLQVSKLKKLKLETFDKNLQKAGII